MDRNTADMDQRKQNNFFFTKTDENTGDGRRKIAGFFVCLILCVGVLFSGLSAAVGADEDAESGENAGTGAWSVLKEETDVGAGESRGAVPENLSLYAQSAVLMDGDSGRILYEKSGYDILPMASTTKIMTCILALENGNPDDMLTVSSYAASMPKVHLGVREGERYRLEDLLYSLMPESHNDSAVVIAEGIGGSVSGFADMMNQKARDIGAYDSFFVTPNGLDATAMCQRADGGAQEREHSTTAVGWPGFFAIALRNHRRTRNFWRSPGQIHICFPMGRQEKLWVL